jgi:hypothetical protein
MGGDVVRRGQPGSPGSGGASPYLRRSLWRQPAPYLNAYVREEISRTVSDCADVDFEITSFAKL